MCSVCGDSNCPPGMCRCFPYMGFRHLYELYLNSEDVEPEGFRASQVAPRGDGCAFGC